jgi:hypothetical protein
VRDDEKPVDIGAAVLAQGRALHGGKLQTGGGEDAPDITFRMRKA